MVWVCLYVLDADHRHPAVSDEVQQNFRTKGFAVKRRSGYLRINDWRDCVMMNIWTIRKATSPDRLIELWRLTES